MKRKRKSRRTFWGRRPFRPNLIHMQRWEEELILRKINELLDAGAPTVSVVELEQANPGLFNVKRLAKVLGRMSKKTQGSSVPGPLVRKHKLMGFGRGRFYYVTRERHEAARSLDTRQRKGA